MKSLTQGHEERAVIRFAIPMLLESVFQQFSIIVDSFVAGRFVGKQALAAVGQSFAVIFVFTSLCAGVSFSGSALVAQHYGARQKARAQDAIDTTLFAIGCFSAAVTLVGLAAAPAILGLMRTPNGVMDDAVLYLRILFLGSFAGFGFDAVSSVLRGLGDSKTPLCALLVSTVVNIALALAFVIFFRWGVAGVGIATVIAQAVALAWTLARVGRRGTGFRISFFPPRPDLGAAKTLVAASFPLGVPRALFGAGLMAVTGVVNGFGMNSAAAFSAAGLLDRFANIPPVNFGLASAAVTGRGFGVGLKGRVRRRGLPPGTLTALAVSLSIALAVFLFGRQFMQLFTTDKEVVRIGCEYLKTVSVGYPILAVMLCFSVVIRGAGATVFPLLVTVLSVWIVRVPCTVVLSRFRGTSGIWWAIVIGYAAGTVGTVLYYFFGAWARKAEARPALPIE